LFGMSRGVGGRLDRAQHDLVNDVRKRIATRVGGRGKHDAWPPHPQPRDDMRFKLFQSLAIVGAVPTVDQLFG